MVAAGPTEDVRTLVVMGEERRFTGDDIRTTVVVDREENTAWVPTWPCTGDRGRP